MKKLSLLFAIVFFAIPVISLSQGFQKVFNSQMYGYPGDVYFLNDSVGYLAGSDGLFRNALFMKSVDGGSSWQHVPGISGNGKFLGDIEFISEDTGFVCGEPGLLYKTTDGGLTWTSKHLPTTYTLEKIRFVNGQLGYMLT
jgi:photosystem II stability/assembly factor-like uncharacterized protein